MTKRKCRPLGVALTCGLGWSAVTLGDTNDVRALDVVPSGRDNVPRSMGVDTPPHTPRRVYANTFALWIYGKPHTSKVPIGYVRAGQVLSLRQPNVVSFDGCKRGWHAVEPAGYVCLDHGGSLEQTRYSQAMHTLAPKPGPFPFEYGVSLGTPAFRRPPSGENNELALHAPLDVSSVVLSELLSDTLLEPKPVPWFYERGGSVSRVTENRFVRRQVPAQTLLSLVSRFDWEQKSYYQVADGTVVPVERVKLLRRSSFEGVWLHDGQSLPLAWPRQEVLAQRLTEPCASKLTSEFPVPLPGQLSTPIHVHPKCMTPGQRRLDARSPIELTGRRMFVAGVLWLETRDGDWLDDGKTRVAVREEPKHALADVSDKWIHFSIQRGALVAYEGNTPVFATLASPGNGELNARGARRLTPKGTFRINFKHITDDMSSEDGEHRSEWKADVPYAMYFDQPYGIHVSYWHEAFGEPKSGGCINVSPIDGARLFDWTEPRLPNGWYGVGSTKELGFGTVVYITD